MKPRHVAVLGAGIMGSSVALLLARKGVHVTLIDEAAEPFSGASRWNEGKIHLGYLYAADPGGRTAARVIPGGLAFKGLTEKLIGRALDGAITPNDDIYLVHRDSVVGAEAMRDCFEKITLRLREHPQARGYLTDVSASRVRVLSRRELSSLTNSALVLGGYRVPERSVQTNWVADGFLAALAAEPRIELALRTRVTGVRELTDGRWRVETAPKITARFDAVVNALWHGRLAVDRTVDLEEETPWLHRFRVSAFVRTKTEFDVPSTVLATGPFGDVKNYNGRDFYLSWYPTGLLAEGTAVAPPAVSMPGGTRRAEMIEEIVGHLGAFLPAVKSVAAAASETRLAGGWVYALGEGSLADRRSSLHRRDQFGIRARGSYLSVDTGKYSTAPWLARKIAARILQR